MWPFKSKKLKSYLIGEKAEVVLAFEHGGHKYYQFKTAFDMSTGRGLQAMTIYEEFTMKVDRSYLEMHVKAIELLLEGPKIRLAPIIEIHANLRERLNLAVYPDHIYKLASVLFFDESESPWQYDTLYNAKKIAAWRADPEMLPFLVRVPLKHLIPFSNIADENLKTYLSVAEVVAKTHLEKISAVLSKVQ